MKTNLTEADFRVQDEGTLIILHPENDAARAWMDEHLYEPDGGRPGWWGGGVVIDHRCAADIVQALLDDGFDVKEGAL